MTTSKRMIQPAKKQDINSLPPVWNSKPWWCQPWSILLTGCCLIIGSWGLFHRIWVTAIVAIPVLTWMGFFILVYPQLIESDEIREDET